MNWCYILASCVQFFILQHCTVQCCCCHCEAPGSEAPVCRLIAHLTVSCWFSKISLASSLLHSSSIHSLSRLPSLPSSNRELALLWRTRNCEAALWLITGRKYKEVWPHVLILHCASSPLSFTFTLYLWICYIWARTNVVLVRFFFFFLVWLTNEQCVLLVTTDKVRTTLVFVIQQHCNNAAGTSIPCFCWQMADEAALTKWTGSLSLLWKGQKRGSVRNGHFPETR